MFVKNMERIKINKLDPLLDSHIRESFLDDDVLIETYAMVAGVDDEDFHPKKETEGNETKPVDISEKDLWHNSGKECGYKNTCVFVFKNFSEKEYHKMNVCFQVPQWLFVLAGTVVFATGFWGFLKLVSLVTPPDPHAKDFKSDGKF